MFVYFYLCHDDIPSLHEVAAADSRIDHRWRYLLSSRVPDIPGTGYSAQHREYTGLFMHKARYLDTLGRHEWFAVIRHIHDRRLWSQDVSLTKVAS